MRISEFPLFTLKEDPAGAEIVSHRLMLRAGLVRSLASGLYTWMPLGLRSLRKVSAVVREEMDAAGAIELSMPSVQPAKLWRESGRWDEYGPELLRLSDRHQNEFAFGPTHEEVITDVARRELTSYRQLPVTFYQIQTKFRDEIRPRFGVMRAREFLMKDAYSFHADDASLERTYRTMFDAYTRIFRRLQLDFRAVRATTGSIGGDFSHEFHVLADSGEDAIAFSTESDYAVNVELAPELKAGGPSPDGKGRIEIQRGIEVGHIFKLGDKYSRAMQFTVLGEGDTAVTPQMGCYGIGVSRIVAAAIEQNHDDNGIVWPQAMAPFTLLLTPVQYHRDDGVRKTIERLYLEFTRRGIDVLLDDRDARAGVMFADGDLIGLPWRLVISPKSMENGVVELKKREQEQAQTIALENCADAIAKMTGA